MLKYCSSVLVLLVTVQLFWARRTRTVITVSCCFSLLIVAHWSFYPVKSVCLMKLFM